MKFKMSQDSLFAILLRSPWWLSLLAAVGVALLARLAFPEPLSSYGVITAFPFLVIAVMAARKQWRMPSAKQTAATLEAAGALSWKEFAARLEEALKREGYTVTPGAGAADFSLAMEGRIGVISARRWKASNHGIEPLRELQGAREAKAAHEAIYVAGSALSENAQRYAGEHKIFILEGAELARILRRVPPDKKP